MLWLKQTVEKAFKNIEKKTYPVQGIDVFAVLHADIVYVPLYFTHGWKYSRKIYESWSHTGIDGLGDFIYIVDVRLVIQKKLMLAWGQ